MQSQEDSRNDKEAEQLFHQDEYPDEKSQEIIIIEDSQKKQKNIPKSKPIKKAVSKRTGKTGKLSIKGGKYANELMVMDKFVEATDYKQRLTQYGLTNEAADIKFVITKWRFHNTWDRTSQKLIKLLFGQEKNWKIYSLSFYSADLNEKIPVELTILDLVYIFGPQNIYRYWSKINLSVVNSVEGDLNLSSYYFNYGIKNLTKLAIDMKEYYKANNPITIHYGNRKQDFIPVIGMDFLPQNIDEFKLPIGGIFIWGVFSGNHQIDMDQQSDEQNRPEEQEDLEQDAIILDDVAVQQQIRMTEMKKNPPNRVIKQMVQAQKLHEKRELQRLRKEEIERKEEEQLTRLRRNERKRLEALEMMKLKPIMEMKSAEMLKEENRKGMMYAQMNELERKKEMERNIKPAPQLMVEDGYVNAKQLREMNSVVRNRSAMLCLALGVKDNIGKKAYHEGIEKQIYEKETSIEIEKKATEIIKFVQRASKEKTQGIKLQFIENEYCLTQDLVQFFTMMLEQMDQMDQEVIVVPQNKVVKNVKGIQKCIKCVNGNFTSIVGKESTSVRANGQISANSKPYPIWTRLCEECVKVFIKAAKKSNSEYIQNLCWSKSVIYYHKGFVVPELASQVLNKFSNFYENGPTWSITCFNESDCHVNISFDESYFTGTKTYLTNEPNADIKWLKDTLKKEYLDNKNSWLVWSEKYMEFVGFKSREDFNYEFAGVFREYEAIYGKLKAYVKETKGTNDEWNGVGWKFGNIVTKVDVVGRPAKITNKFEDILQGL